MFPTISLHMSKKLQRWNNVFGDGSAGCISDRQLWDTDFHVVSCAPNTCENAFLARVLTVPSYM